jgi:hypothetical protein
MIAAVFWLPKPLFLQCHFMGLCTPATISACRFLSFLNSMTYSVDFLGSVTRDAHRRLSLNNLTGGI